MPNVRAETLIEKQMEVVLYDYRPDKEDVVLGTITDSNDSRVARAGRQHLIVLFLHRRIRGELAKRAFGQRDDMVRTGIAESQQSLEIAQELRFGRRQRRVTESNPIRVRYF